MKIQEDSYLLHSLGRCYIVQSMQTVFTLQYAYIVYYYYDGIRVM